MLRACSNLRCTNLQDNRLRINRSTQEPQIGRHAPGDTFSRTNERLVVAVGRARPALRVGRGNPANGASQEQPGAKYGGTPSTSRHQRRPYHSTGR